MNKNIYKLCGVTEEEYRTWCKDYNRAHYLPKTKKEFFDGLQAGTIVRSETSGKLIRKAKIKK